MQTDEGGRKKQEKEETDWYCVRGRNTKGTQKAYKKDRRRTRRKERRTPGWFHRWLNDSFNQPMSTCTHSATKGRKEGESRTGTLDDKKKKERKPVRRSTNFKSLSPFPFPPPSDRHGRTGT